MKIAWYVPGTTKQADLPPSHSATPAHAAAFGRVGRGRKGGLEGWAGDMASGSVGSDRQPLSEVTDGDGFIDGVCGSVSLYKIFPIQSLQY